MVPKKKIMGRMGLFLPEGRENILKGEKLTHSLLDTLNLLIFEDPIPNLLQHLKENNGAASPNP